MRRTVVALLAGFTMLVPSSLAMAASAPPATDVSIDAKVLNNAKVERNGKHIGTVQRVMVNPTTGRISHVDILMTEGQSRTISVPWSGVKLFQDNGGDMVVSLSSRAAAEASPSADPRIASVPRPVTDVVRDAQQALRERGYYRGVVDGVVGPITEAAVRGFQRDQNLPVTGRLDTQTVQNLLNEAPVPSASPSTSPLTDVQMAQRELRLRGYYTGPIDGVIGPQTTAAVRGYQRDHNLSATGRLDARTMRSLSLSRG